MEKIVDILEKKKEHVWIFISDVKKSTGFYHILKKTKSPLVLVNVTDTDGMNELKWFNRRFNLHYRPIKDYSLGKNPEEFCKSIRDNIYDFYHKNKKEQTIKMENLNERLDFLERKIDLILEILQKNTENCEKMSSHIDFVEATYETLRSPLDFIRRKLSSDSTSLPQIKR